MSFLKICSDMFQVSCTLLQILNWVGEKTDPCCSLFHSHHHGQLKKLPAGLAFIRSQTCSASVVTTDSDGFIIKLLTTHRNTKKASLECHSLNIFVDHLTLGKYLLEREKLVKENAWTLDDPPITE